MKLKSKIIYNILKPIIFILFKILYLPKSFNKENIPKSGAILIAGNHKHAFDPVLVAVSTNRTVNLLAKKELYEGINKIFLQSLGIIQIDLNNKNPEAMDKLEQILRNHEAIAIFPEAKRNYTDKIILPFKYGTVSLAKKTNALIVPCGIKGSYGLFKKGLTVTFGEPFSIEGMELTEANEYLMQKVKELIEK